MFAFKPMKCQQNGGNINTFSLIWELIMHQPFSCFIQGLLMVLQNLPTIHWGNEEVGLLLAEAYRLKYMFADAPRHYKRWGLSELSYCSSPATQYWLNNGLKEAAQPAPRLITARLCGWSTSSIFYYSSLDEWKSRLLLNTRLNVQMEWTEGQKFLHCKSSRRRLHLILRVFFPPN